MITTKPVLLPARSIVLAVLLAGELATASAQQCLQDDNLSGPCWTQVGANLPAFPAVSLPGLGVCWDDCEPQPGECINVGIGAPSPGVCGRFSAPLTIDDCQGNSVLGSSLTLDYSRTWQETTGVDPQVTYQVYRFLVKTDLLLQGQGPDCVVPSCLPAWPTAFAYGYLDYAKRCSDGSFEASLILFHGCDLLNHDTVISDKPGAFHPERSYAWVAPSTAANPFSPVNMRAPDGAVAEEAVRNVPAPGIFSCITEEPVSGNIQTLFEACACQLALSPDQVSLRDMSGAGTCFDAGVASSFTSLNTFPGLPWFEVLTHSIGEWTTDVTYPGKEKVWVDEGAFIYHDSCVTAAGNGTGNFAELFFGATTSDGFQASDLEGVDIPEGFTDLANNYSVPLPGQIVFPLVGSVNPTQHLIYLNY